MKHTKLLLYAFLSIISISSFAQFNNIYLGPEGGPGLGILWGNINAKQYRVPIATGTAGYAFQYNFTKIISIRTDIAYERAGSDYNYSSLSFSGTSSIARYKLDYMTLPVLARATFGKKVNFFINAGPYFGVLLREIYVAESPSYGKVIENNTGYYKRFDIGITEGLGILVPIGSSFAVSFEARDNTGLYNINKPQPGLSNYITRNNTTNFIFAFIYKLVTKKPAAKQKT